MGWCLGTWSRIIQAPVTGTTTLEDVLLIQLLFEAIGTGYLDLNRSSVDSKVSFVQCINGLGSDIQPKIY